MKKLNGLIILLGILVLTSCDPDPGEVNGEEIITTLTYTLTPTGGGDAVTFKFLDLDGDGGDAPTFTSEDLAENTTYEGSIELLNESVDPTEDITEEVEEEGLDHQLFFESTVGDLSISYDDVDASSNPIGLKTQLTTGAAGTGNLTIILRHEPNKSATGVSDGDITNAGGSTDIQVTFDVNVK